MKTAVLASAAAAVSATPWSGSLYVDTAPPTPRPYVLPKLSGQAVSIGSQIYRFAVTGNSSGGAFTLMNTHAPDSPALGVLPHIHRRHYENFYCAKGRVNLWAARNETGHHARELSPGDYGAVPPGTTHTFQMTDPDTQLTGVIAPGGFEELFIAIGDGAYASPTGAEFVPAAAPGPPPGTNNSGPGAAGPPPGMISQLQSFDVFAQLDFQPRQDMVNGSAPVDATWHTGSSAQALAPSPRAPAFVAKNRGPKFLHAPAGASAYQLVAPLSRAAHTRANFSMGTITMSAPFANASATSPSSLTLPQPVAFQLEEGELHVSVGKNASARLIQGDVLFVPAGTEFSYTATRPFTRWLYVTGGGEGSLDELLIAQGKRWDWASYPVAPGVVVQG
ncbi:uncharacterized protein K452DRAFT_288467 [Aplosporella prunicola CBS 121167]|uniref:Cupin 2 conserved barrel domain-containing protein n=1 Tax=Aplosporella prunicola CBS 121167 TaxID=1176127 RepID=A0A6A6BBV3_9PEZI|nr:uncharacterized protein K452DRAFT_288467 [Aplosporella prunicola CBS 121167]KAF2141088.1 hypothetical protein K452DRAFT_288467 [Aplosporella prunicola CBS 121167]